MANYPLINGREYSFSQIRIKAKGKEYFSAKSINYKATKTKGKLYGNGQGLLGKTRGNREYTADMEITRREFDQLKADLMKDAPSGAGFGDVDFDIEVTYRETGMPTVIDEIIGVNIDESDLSNSQGTDATMVKLTLCPFKMKLNGHEI